MNLFDDEKPVDEYPVRYRFSFDDVRQDLEHGTRDIDYGFTIDSSVPWTDVLTKFLDFLGSVYGYSVAQEVKYDGNPWTEDYELKDARVGGTDD